MKNLRMHFQTRRNTSLNAEAVSANKEGRLNTSHLPLADISHSKLINELELDLSQTSKFSLAHRKIDLSFIQN